MNETVVYLVSVSGALAVGHLTGWLAAMRLGAKLRRRADDNSRNLK